MSEFVHFIEAGDGEAARKHQLTLLATCGLTYVPHPLGLKSDLPSCPKCERINGPIDRGTPASLRSSDSRPSYVYRHYDGDGRLLYVGCTVDPKTRQLGHQQSSWWFNQSAKVRMTIYPNRLHALRVEREAILHERPIWNVRHQDYSTWGRDQILSVRELARGCDAPDPVLRRFDKLASAA